MTFGNGNLLFFQNIIDNIPIGIFLKDLNGNILLANRHYYNSIGDLSSEKSENKIYKNIEISKKEDSQILKTKEGQSFSRKIYLKNGLSGWRKIIKIPIYDQNNFIQNILVISINTNHEKQLQEQKDTSTATLTHDLNTPISAQICALDLLLNKTFGSLNKMQENILSQIKDSCHYTKNIAGNILDTYLYEHGQIKTDIEEFDWNTFLDEIIKEISCLANEKSQRIINFSGFFDNNITADKFQLKRVITNLISNAIKYGNNKSEIEIFSNLDDNLFFSIKNHSKYITKDNLDEIYEKFQTCESKRKSSGLGLYLVKQIVEAHNGYVFANSKPNGECTFGFAIPQKVKVQTN